MAAHLLRFSPLPSFPPSIPTSDVRNSLSAPFPISLFQLPSSSSTTRSLNLYLARSQSLNLSGSGNDSGGNFGGGGTGGSGGGGGDQFSDGSSKPDAVGPLGFFINGWRSRVSADPQFPFKVLMEEIVGVSSCVLGDMASRPNFGLNELDFVFSTLVVGSILNFVLMYLLAPTAASASSSLPGVFARCPAGHMFESGAYSVFNRLGTFIYKGAVFGAVGFAAGLVGTALSNGLIGTALSNGLIGLRKKMDPEFETPNKPPPTMLNALTWAIHMGVSSNFRYQTLNGLEFLLAKSLSPVAFKANVVVLRCMNNVLGGVSFVVLARLTGSQKVEKKVEQEEENLISGEETRKTLVSDSGYGELQGNETHQSTSSSK